MTAEYERFERRIRQQRRYALVTGVLAWIAAWVACAGLIWGLVQLVWGRP